MDEPGREGEDPGPESGDSGSDAGDPEKPAPSEAGPGGCGCGSLAGLLSVLVLAGVALLPLNWAGDSSLLEVLHEAEVGADHEEPAPWPTPNVEDSLAAEAVGHVSITMADSSLRRVTQDGHDIGRTTVSTTQRVRTRPETLYEVWDDSSRVVCATGLLVLPNERVCLRCDPVTRTITRTPCEN